MTQLLTVSPLAAQQLAVVLRAKRILYEAAEVAAGRLVAVRYGNSYSLYPARVAAYVRQQLGAPTPPCDGLAVSFTTQGHTEAQYYDYEAVLAAMLALRAHSLATRRQTQRRIAGNNAKIARLRSNSAVGGHQVAVAAEAVLVAEGGLIA
jgi:heme exporter protein D